MLPLVAAAKAATVIAENANARNGVAYRGVAILVPWQTEPLEEHATTKTDEAFSAVDQKRDELEQLGAEAEEAAHEANASRKKRIATIVAVRPTIACMNARRISHI